MKKFFLYLFFLFFIIRYSFPAVSNFLNYEGYSIFEKGTFNQTSVTSEGEISISNKYEIISETNYEIVWNILESKNNDLFLFTGFNGIIKNYNKNIEYKTELNSVLCYFEDFNGDIYCGGIGNFLYKINNDTIIKFATISDTYIWCIENYDANYLIIGTGLNGNIYKVSKKNGEINLLTKTEFDNILCLKKLNDKEIIFGTSNSANLYVLKDNKISILTSLIGDEINGIEQQENNLYISINQKKKQTTQVFQPVETKSDVELQKDKGIETQYDDSEEMEENENLEEKVEKNKNNEASEKIQNQVTNVKVSQSQSQQMPQQFYQAYGGQNGKIIKYSLNTGKIQEIYSTNKGYIYDIFIKNNELYVAIGNENKLIKIDMNTNSFKNIIKTESKDFIVLSKTNNNYFYAISKQPIEIYKIYNDIADTGEYISEIIKFDNQTKIGEINYLPQFNKKNIKFYYRQGYSDKVDTYWYDWTDKINDLKKSLFFQYKILLEKSDDKIPIINKIILPYKSDNQKPIIASITIKKIITGEVKRNQKNFEKSQNSKSEKELNVKEKITINWQVQDDDEQLIYNLYYKNLNNNMWIKINEKTLKETNYVLNTRLLNDGYYIFKVEAKDELVNSIDDAYITTKLSEIILIDNTPPEFILNKFEINDDKVFLSANLKDNLSIIKEQFYQIDFKDWKYIEVSDLINDSTNEKIEIIIGNLEKGPHILNIKFTDMSENESTFTKEFEIK
ncbi:MAG TPA: hypothetical protein PK189_07655 [bacterium]|nr:hypothetical protein [bacterium]